MARAENGVTISSSSLASRSLGSPCHEVFVRNDSDSSNPLNVRIASNANSIHGTGEYFTLAVGESIYFAAAKGDEIRDVELQGNGGNAKASWTVTVG